MPVLLGGSGTNLHVAIFSHIPKVVTADVCVCSASMEAIRTLCGSMETNILKLIYVLLSKTKAKYLEKLSDQRES